MKKALFLIFTVLFIGFNGKSQVKSEIEHAFEVVDEGLKSAQSEEYQKYFEKLRNSKKLEKEFLKQINFSGNQIAINASKEIVSNTYQIEAKIDSIVDELENAYTLDDHGNFNNKKSKMWINQIMIDKKRGLELEEMITKNSERLEIIEDELKLAKSESLDKLQSNLSLPENESWAEYNFLNMPVVAAVPLLKKLRNDAMMTRIELLESINKL